MVLLDDVDAVACRREWQDDGTTGVNERVLSTLLNEMDGVSKRKGVLVVACTNRRSQLDDALLRPGRIDKQIHVGNPSDADRLAMLHASLKDRKHGLDASQLEWVANVTHGLSGASLLYVMREALLHAAARSEGTLLEIADVEDSINMFRQRAALPG
jgi:ATP-dependent 26S proteasome regulatory subunit